MGEEDNVNIEEISPTSTVPETETASEKQQDDSAVAAGSEPSKSTSTPKNSEKNKQLPEGMQ